MPFKFSCDEMWIEVILSLLGTEHGLRPPETEIWQCTLDMTISCSLIPKTQRLNTPLFTRICLEPPNPVSSFSPRPSLTLCTLVSRCLNQTWLMGSSPGPAPLWKLSLWLNLSWYFVPFPTFSTEQLSPAYFSLIFSLFCLCFTKHWSYPKKPQAQDRWLS